MTPTLRKLYHRRGKLLSYLNEIDRQIAAFDRCLVCYDDGILFEIGILEQNTIDCGGMMLLTFPPNPHITILEKGFEK